jgi:hypothetical protein
MIQDDLIVRLGRAMQKVMSLSVEKRALAQRVEAAEARTEILDELIFDIVPTCIVIWIDLHDGADFREILWRIREVMLKIDEEDRENEEDEEDEEQPDD